MNITNTLTRYSNMQSLPVKQTAKKTSCFSDTLSSVAEIRDLAADFDPQHMSETQYNDFLNSLVQKGVLSEQEKYWAGYAGCGVDVPGICDVPVTYSRSLDEAQGNALSFARGMSAVHYYPSSGESDSPMNKVSDVFKRIDSVLEQMLSSHGR